MSIEIVYCARTQKIVSKVIFELRNKTLNAKTVYDIPLNSGHSRPQQVMAPFLLN